LQVEQDDELHPAQDEPLEASEPPFSLAPAMPNMDIFLSGFAHAHFGQTTSVLLYTSFSKSSPHRGQWYS
jgi:hypothetical protein